MVGPGGGLPWFGDYGGTQNSEALLIAAFERAATVYHDGRFKWAAHRVYQSDPHSANEKTPGKTYNGWQLFGFGCAYAWADDSIARSSRIIPRWFCSATTVIWTNASCAVDGSAMISTP